MKIFLLASALFLSNFAQAQNKHTVFVVDKVVTVSTGTANNYGVFGTVSRGSTGERHTAPVMMGEFTKRHCESVAFTENQSAADFTLNTHVGGSTLTDPKGNIVYISTARNVKNTEKDICEYLASH